MARKKKEKKHCGLYVEVRNNDVDTALKIFKRKIKDAGLMLEIQRREQFTKPSAIRRDKRNRAKRRAQYNTKNKQ